MCRNIRQLHNFEPPATKDEVHGASLQYVRKISGATKPSQANQAAFYQAVAEVEAATRRLLDHLSQGFRRRVVPGAREVEGAAVGHVERGHHGDPLGPGRRQLLQRLGGLRRPERGGG